MSTASATVVQANLTGSQLLWTDTGSYGTIVSRNLTIYDCNGVVLLTVSLGTTTTYTYNITADAFYQFICVVVDNTGTFTSTVDFVAIGFYTAAYLGVFNSTSLGNTGILCNLDAAENFLNAALRFNLAGNFVAANANIVAANVLVNMQN